MGFISLFGQCTLFVRKCPVLLWSQRSKEEPCAERTKEKKKKSFSLVRPHALFHSPSLDLRPPPSSPVDNYRPAKVCAERARKSLEGPGARPAEIETSIREPSLVQRALLARYVALPVSRCLRRTLPVSVFESPLPFLSARRDEFGSWTVNGLLCMSFPLLVLVALLMVRRSGGSYGTESFFEIWAPSVFVLELGWSGEEDDPKERIAEKE